MNDLVEFLLACIGEDERGEGVWGEMEVSGADRVVGKEEREQVRRIFLSYHRRIAAECEAKRQIVAEWQAENAFDRHPSNGYLAAYAQACRLLATAYASHSDYREEWKP